MQSTILQDETQPESGIRELTSRKSDTTHNIIVIEQKHSNLEVEYKQKRQWLEQQKSVLVTKDMLHTSRTVYNHLAEKHTCLVNIVVVLTTNPRLAHRKKCAPHVRPKVMD